MKLLEVKNLHTYFDTSHGVIEAVRGVNFGLYKKEFLGIVGESGSGKSQTVMSILKLFEDNQRIAEGEIVFEGQTISNFNDKQLSSIRGKEIAVIFQDSISCLNPVFTIGRQITELLIFHQKMSKKDAYAEGVRMLSAVKIKDPDKVMLQYPHQLSGGMSQRVMIAIALACKPKILIADEPTTALDVIIQDEILSLMNDLKTEFNTSIIFISHDLGVVSSVADRIIVMHKGRIVEEGPTAEIINRPHHPYTKELLKAFLMTDIRNHDEFKEYLSSPFTDTNYYFKWPKEDDLDFIDLGSNHKISATRQ